jgi:hypothetical protein
LLVSKNLAVRHRTPPGSARPGTAAAPV